MKNGFTLVELAIVIVIIGLLVGGVLQGQELIRQAQLRSMMSNIESYKAAMHGFYAKYSCHAGDCIKTYDFFGAECGTNTAITSSNTTGCNGNGDSALSTAEGQKAWDHLSRAKLVKGTYTGAYTANMVAGQTLPGGSINGSVYMIMDARIDVSGSACGWSYCLGFGGFSGSNVITFGSINNPPRNYPRGGLFTPREAFEIDTKFDDGIYYSGIISGEQAAITDGTVVDCGSTTSKIYYTTPETSCRIIFKL